MLQRKRMGDILVDLQVITTAEVDRVLHAMRRRLDQSKFGQVARDMGLIREEHILAALAVQMDLFPGVQDMSLTRLLGRLQAPVTPLRLPVIRPAKSGAGRRAD